MIPRFLNKKTAMTLAEILIVVALISLVSVAIYNALTNGLKVWNRSRSLIVEEEVAVFFEKITEEARNGFPFSLIPFEGNELRFAFPTRIKTLVDQKRRGQDEEYVEQVGRIEYYFDPTKDTLFKRTSVYGQAVNYQTAEAKEALTGISDFRFRYDYITDHETLYSQEVLDVLPVSVEITVKFMDRGKEKTLSKTVDLPLGGSS